ncbi:molybdopterin synthase subunit MoaD [Halopseudomonas xinjiangensis]|uniref:Molybdopterin synthase sulfur carrier subunit n=1 Tax=Halopseudomonas xinjiangensis TaxID=487184 RepID=A0A1H1N5R4_9GAMM|nr:molybdopterin converting factor subunit 1 [Halopseudomonas xinjiangensis]SDR94383.1 molybdopterin synthase subunit MoaD [Halopseudomonas xinjiangensis]
MITLQYFARYRETLGTGQEQLDWNDSRDTLRAVRDELVSRGDAWAVLNESRLMCARNQEMCSLDEPVRDGDEIAFFPPVTGG